jgi:hypothetical protein
MQPFTRGKLGEQLKAASRLLQVAVSEFQVQKEVHGSRPHKRKRDILTAVISFKQNARIEFFKPSHNHFCPDR